MNPAEEQARRDYEESLRQQRAAEERQRAEREAREMEIRIAERIASEQAMKEARIRAQQSGPPNWHW